MKNIPSRFAIACLFVCSALLQTNAQNTQTLFARPGLSIGAYHYNFFDGTWNTSLRYAGDTLLCGDTLLVFEWLSNTNTKVFFEIEGNKVYYRYPCNPGVVFYDFGLQVGETFDAPNGPMFTVIETGQKTLLNGDVRRHLVLTVNPAMPLYTIEWIEGIGDVTLGLLPFFADFEGYDQFVCARDSSGDLWFDASKAYLCDSLLCPVPFAHFSAAQSDDFTFQFENLSHNAQLFEWDFGDGHTSADFSPQHTYAAQGCYDVCLTIRSNCLTVPRKVCKPVNAGTERGWVELPFNGVPDGTTYLVDIEFSVPDTGWVISTKKVWKTTDGGQTWAEQSLPPNASGAAASLRSLFIANSQMGIIGAGGSAGDAKMYVTFNGGQTWLPRMVGTSVVQDAILQPSGQSFAIAQYNNLFHSLDFGQQWAEKAYPSGLGGLFHPLKLLPIQGDTLYLLGFIEPFGAQPFMPILLRSADAGDTWTYDVFTEFPLQQQGFFLDGQRGWLPGSEGYLLETADAGASWVEVEFNESSRAADISFASLEHGWAVGANGLILHTTDGGQTWVRENCGDLVALLRLTTPADSVAYAVNQAGKILKYCGGDCALIPTSEPPMPVESPLLSVSPNPASARVEIRLLSRESSIQPGDNVLLFNQLGQTKASAKSAGASVFLEVAHLPAGWYGLLLLRDGAPVAQGQFIVAH